MIAKKLPPVNVRWTEPADDYWAEIDRELDATEEQCRDNSERINEELYWTEKLRAKGIDPDAI